MMSEGVGFAILAAIVLLLRWAQMGIGLFALIAWPGTVAHEACHAAVGLILGAKPRGFTVWPTRIGGGRWRLGSVSFANITWWNAAPTALAPLLLAPAAVWLLRTWALDGFFTDGPVYGAGRAFMCAILLQAAWPSLQDFKVAARGLVPVASVLGIAWWLGLFKNIF